MDYETCVVLHNLFPYAIFAKRVPLVVQLLRQNLYDAFASPTYKRMFSCSYQQ